MSIMDQVYGEFYAEYDEDSALWCVFNTETSQAYSTHSDEASAKEAVKERQERQMA
jgi:hypothetical protein